MGFSPGGHLPLNVLWSQIVAKWHIEELHDMLSAKGRRMTECPRDGYQVAGSWEVQRSTREQSLYIDFAGQGDMRCLSMEEAYACRVKSRPNLSLYFGRKGPSWNQELREFVDALNLG